MKLKVKQAFSWAHRGVQVEEFGVGQTIDTEDADLIRVSLHEGWTTKAKADKPEGNPKAVLEKEIADLEEQLKAAAEPDKPAIQTEMDAKRAALAVL